MVKISIIIPVYNAENYLQKSIESVLAQTYKNGRPILVNDGSVDSSGSICDSYAQKDCRVKVIHQQNQGVSVARNNGIKNSTGEWITFVDADDEIDICTYENLMQTIISTSADIVLYDSVAVKNGEIVENETIESLTESCVLHKQTIKPENLLEMAGAVWRCIYRASLIKDNNILFPEKLKIAEDRIFNIYAMGMASKIAYEKTAYYKRNLLEGSTVHKYHKDYYETVKKGKEATHQAIKYAWGDNEILHIAYLNQFVYASIRAIENLKHKDSPLSYRERKKQVKLICQDEELKDAIIKTGYDKKDERALWILKKKVGRLSRKNLTVYRFISRLKSAIKRRLFKR